MKDLKSFRRIRDTQGEETQRDVGEDIVEATMLVADTVEAKGNQVIDAVDNSTAATELVAENTETSNDLLGQIGGNTEVSGETLIEISDKLSSFADLLKKKLDIHPEAQQMPSTGVSVVEDAIPEQAEQPSLEDLVRKLLPDPEVNPEEKFFPPEEEPQPAEPPEERKKRNDKEDQGLELQKMILKSVKGGFKASYGVIDRIAGMLFTYTVSALANMAKWAAMLFGLVLGVDLLLIHFKHWSKMFDTQLESIDKNTGMFAPYLKNLYGSIEQLRKYWTEGKYGQFIIEILKGAGYLFVDLMASIMFGISKLVAGVLRSMGMNDAADNVEANAAYNYAMSSGYTPTEEEQAKINKHQGKFALDRYNEMKDNMKGKSREEYVKDASSSKWTDWATGRTPITPEQAGKDYDKYANTNMSPEQVQKASDEQVDIDMKLATIKRDTARSANNEKHQDELLSRLSAIKKQIAASSMTEGDKGALQAQADDLETQLKAKKAATTAVKPESPKGSMEAQQVNGIEQGIQAKQTPPPAPQTTALQNVNNIRQNKTVIQHQVRTGFDAPGMYPYKTNV